MTFVIVVALFVGLLSLCAGIHSAHYSRRIETKFPAMGDFVEIGGQSSHVIRYGGAGPFVMMLHGASANAREFTETLAPHLAGDHRVCLLDRPGHGYSDRPARAERLGVQARQASDVLQALAAGEPAILVGHSFGGAVALRTALDYPDQVAGLVLLAPITHDWGGGGEAWYNRYARHWLLAPFFNPFASLFGPKQAPKAVRKVFDPAPAPASYVDSAALGLLFRPKAFRANAEDVSAVRAELAAQQARYAELKLPVTVYSGAGDTVLSPQRHVGRLKHQVPHLELIKLADDGHMPHHAYASEIAARIAQLAMHSPSPGSINMA